MNADRNEFFNLSLRELPEFQPIYVLPEDDLLGDVIIPCLRIATAYDCLIAFFQSGALRDMAPGLAEFLSRPGGKIRLAISPFLAAEDQEAIRAGNASEPDLLARRLEELYGSARIDSSALVKYTLECLAFLVASHRVEFKLVLVRDGLFHPKVRIFSDGENRVIVHGSNNLTQAGFTKNYEQVMVSKSWAAPDQQRIADRMVKEFDSIWNGLKGDRIKVYDVSEAFKERIVREYSPACVPTAGGFWDAWDHDWALGLVDGRNADDDGKLPKKRQFAIPLGLEYEQGDFEHQGRAIRAWEAANRHGVLEMATGSGKTVTALIAARRLLDQARPLLLVVGAVRQPYVDSALKCQSDSVSPSRNMLIVRQTRSSEQLPQPGHVLLHPQGVCVAVENLDAPVALLELMYELYQSVNVTLWKKRDHCRNASRPMHSVVNGTLARSSTTQVVEVLLYHWVVPTLSLIARSSDHVQEAQRVYRRRGDVSKVLIASKSQLEMKKRLGFLPFEVVSKQPYLYEARKFSIFERCPRAASENLGYLVPRVSSH